jgi:acyl-CoA thioester hydrolase
MTKTFTTRTRVRYAETDASGIVYYANYLIYFELGRLDMFRELGLPYDKHLPIVDTYCRYHASAKFEDLLEIQSTVDELRSKGFRLGHKVYRVGADETADLLLAEGYTAMVTAGEGGRPIPIPAPFLEAFKEAI